MLIISLISFIVTIPIFSYQITPIFYSRITSIILIYSALLNYNCYYYDSLASGINIFSGLFNITIITLSIEIFILFIGSIILYNWGPIIINKFIPINNVNITILPTIKEFFILILFTIIGSTILISSYDIISIYLSIELQSFAIYIIVTLYRNSESATYAGLKYYLLGGLSSTIILLGCRFIYSYTGITQFDNLYILIQVINENINININRNKIFSIDNSIIFGIVLITFGFLFKIAAAPIHNWAPDVYDSTPTIITIWLIIIPKISIFIFFLEIISKFTYYININYLNNLILICSFISIIIGSIVGLNQYRIKRLFTYSTINHIGFILLRLSINTEISIYSFLFYLIQYSIINLNIFRIVLAFSYIIINKINNQINKKNFYIEIEYLEEFKRQFINNPLLSISFCICLFSIAGVPPLIGFYAKQRVLYTSIHNGYYFISIICILISVISAFYYLKIVRFIFFDKINNNTNIYINTNTNTYYQYNSITNIHSILISIITIFIILFIFEPSILINSCNIIALSIYNY